MGEYLGLDYAAITPAATMMDLQVDADLFERLRDLELEALRLLKERLETR